VDEKDFERGTGTTGGKPYETFGMEPTYLIRIVLKEGEQITAMPRDGYGLDSGCGYVYRAPQAKRKIHLRSKQTGGHGERLD